MYYASLNVISTCCVIDCSASHSPSGRILRMLPDRKRVTDSARVKRHTAQNINTDVCERSAVHPYGPATVVRSHSALGPILGPRPVTRPLARYGYGVLAPTPGAHFEPGAGSKAHPSVGLKRAWQTRGRDSLLARLNDRGLIAETMV